MAFFYIELYVIKITNTIFIKKKKQTISYLLLWHFFSPHIKDFDIVKKLLVGGICKLSHLQFLLIMTICVFFFFFLYLHVGRVIMLYIFTFCSFTFCRTRNSVCLFAKQCWKEKIQLRFCKKWKWLTKWVSSFYFPIWAPEKKIFRNNLKQLNSFQLL